MHWIYILGCEENVMYVGETTRLYRRFWEHQEGRGGENTSSYPPIELIGIYKVHDIHKFEDYQNKIRDLNDIDDGINEENEYLYRKAYNSLTYWNDNEYNEDYYETSQHYDGKYLENSIVELLIKNNPSNNDKIRGGKYTRFDCKYTIPSDDIIEIPFCKCNIPCDIKKNDSKNILYFRCAKKNIWGDLEESINLYVNYACNYYKEYTEDKLVKIQMEQRNKNRSEILKKLFKKSSWLKNINEYSNNPYDKCVGNCGKMNHKYQLIKYYGLWRTLCFDCFIDKNELLCKKYTKELEFLSDSD
jgi:hypothetical protein